MRPVRNQAMDGMFADFIPKANHHNMVTPSLGRFSFGSVFFVRTKKMNPTIRSGTDLTSSIAIAILNKKYIPSP